MKIETNYKIILFDGVCNLCNNSVNFIIKNEKANTFKFAALQSEVGQDLLKKHQLNSKNIDSIVLIDKDKSFVKSTAALYISKNLKGLYPAFFVFIIIPTFIRNWVYDLVAKKRYKWFGKKENCMIPTPTLKNKFL
ncbi:MAG: thiol-disulfide oxidoreductase DCC family protein [Flavobacteriales bacterium]